MEIEQVTDFNGRDVVKSMDEDRKIAEGYVLEYEAMRKEYDTKKMEWLFNTQAAKPIDENIGGGKSNLPGKPVEEAALKSAQYDMNHPEYLWLQAVSIALKTFGERKRIFIRVRREAEHKNNGGCVGRPGWVVYTQRRYYEEIQDRFLNGGGWLAERTIKSWWKEILDVVVEVHLRIKNNFGQH